MGYTTCGLHGRRTCWRCDRCPTCQPDTGRLLRGDYCRKCTDELKDKGYVWSDYCKNYVEPTGKAVSLNAELFVAPFNLAGELIDNSTTDEGKARAAVEAGNAQRKAQRSLFECGGNFDGFTCGSDADSGL